MSDPSPRILVVDDEEMIRTNLAAFLEDDGFTALEAESGEEALKILENETADVGIYDMRLPGMDGNTLILKIHELRPEIKAIIYTGSTTYSAPPEIAALGIGKDQIFQKPIPDMAILVDCINHLLEERQTE